MTFINGIVSFARDVLGIPEPASETKTNRTNAEPQRGRVASDSKTEYDAKPKTTSPTSNTALQDRLREMRSARDTQRGSTTRGGGDTSATPPHTRANRDDAPPASSTGPLSDSQAGAAVPSRSTDAYSSTGQASTGVRATARATVIDAADGSNHGTTDDLSGQQTTAAAAAQNVQSGLDYYASRFGRDGIDNAGSSVTVLINDRSLDEHGQERFTGNGGYYATTYSDGSVSEAIHFGRGTQYEGDNGTVSQNSMLYSDDLAIHELTHGVIRKETGHLGGSANDAGATNEAFADVMAASATRDWTIGEGMYGAESDYKNMRNIANPNDTTSIHGLYTSLDEVREVEASGEEAEEHWASGVISTAAYRVQTRLGGEAGWNAVEQVFYDTIDQNRLGDMSFEMVANGLRTSAATTYGTGSVEYQVFDEELRRAGL